MADGGLLIAELNFVILNDYSHYSRSQCDAVFARGFGIAGGADF
jgi:hypothetical protein